MDNLGHSSIKPEDIDTTTNIGVPAPYDDGIHIDSSLTSFGYLPELGNGFLERTTISKIEGLVRFYNEGGKYGHWVTNISSIRDYQRIGEVLALKAPLISGAKKSSVSLLPGCRFAVSLITYENHALNSLKDTVVFQYYVHQQSIDAGLIHFGDGQVI